MAPDHLAQGEGEDTGQKPPARPPAALTVGSALPDEVPVELVVDVDLHVVHPVALRDEHRERGDGPLRRGAVDPAGRWPGPEPEAGSGPSPTTGLRDLLRLRPRDPLKDFSSNEDPSTHASLGLRQLPTAAEPATGRRDGPLVPVSDRRSDCHAARSQPHTSRARGALEGAPYQVLHHGFDLLPGHVHVLRGAFQRDLVFALCELNVNLPPGISRDSQAASARRP